MISIEITEQKTKFLEIHYSFIFKLVKGIAYARPMVTVGEYKNIVEQI